MTRLLPVACTMHTVASGDPVDQYGDATLTATGLVTSCYIEQVPRGETELGQYQDNVESSLWIIHLPGEIAVPHGADYLTIGDDQYNFIGDPWPVINARTGETSHYEGRARRIT